MQAYQSSQGLCCILILAQTVSVRLLVENMAEGRRKKGRADRHMK